uniref:Matrix metalloproteinase-like protein n=1 Tax=Gnathostoma spinigerum TaxID=75299 RepID=Q9NAY8_9BILA|nr:matrix metalloproteinase-like protein [Gnathostoma spinigerum]
MKLQSVIWIFVIYYLVCITSSSAKPERKRRHALCTHKEPMDATGSYEGPWPSNIKYNITHYTSDMPEEKIRRIIKDALGTWTKVLPLTFEFTTGKGDLEFRFGSGGHFGCPWPFDGPGNLLAHAQPPRYGAFTHYDDDELFGEWTQQYIDNGRRPFMWDLRSLVIHEVGHYLGLGHSPDRDDIMYPMYSDPIKDGKFVPAKPSKNDVYVAQQIHGARNGRYAREVPPPVPRVGRMLLDVPPPMP